MPEIGTYYLTAADAEGLVIRPAATTDEATPNHNAVAAQNLIRLAALSGDDHWRDKADRLIAAIAPLIAENLYMHLAMLNAIDLRLRGAEIVVTGQGAAAEALLKAARRPAAARPHRASRRLCRGTASFTPGARQTQPPRASRKPSSASARPVRCRSPILQRCAAIEAMRGLDASGVVRLRTHPPLARAQRGPASPSGRQDELRGDQVFIDLKNSALFLVLRSLSSRKSMASIVPIGLRMRRSTYIFLS